MTSNHGMTGIAISIRMLPALALTVIGAGCSSPTAPVCPENIDYAIQVSFMDASTHEALLGPTSGAIQDGKYVDSLFAPGFVSDSTVVIMVAGLNRPGTYLLTAERPGFQPYRMEDIVVRDSPCGPLTQYLSVELHPE